MHYVSLNFPWILFGSSKKSDYLDPQSIVDSYMGSPTKKVTI